MPIKEKQNRNRAVIALNLCGFNQREIGDLLGADRRNIQLFVKKYTNKYLESVLDALIKHLADTMLKPKDYGRPKNPRGSKTPPDKIPSTP